MKRISISILFFFLAVNINLVGEAQAYNYGDYRSVTLVSKAWAALAEEDIEAVLAYTNKCRARPLHSRARKPHRVADAGRHHRQFRVRRDRRAVGHFHMVGDSAAQGVEG